MLIQHPHLSNETALSLSLSLCVKIDAMTHFAVQVKHKVYTDSVSLSLGLLNTMHLDIVKLSPNLKTEEHWSGEERNHQHFATAHWITVSWPKEHSKEHAQGPGIAEQLAVQGKTRQMLGHMEVWVCALHCKAFLKVVSLRVKKFPGLLGWNYDHLKVGTMLWL